MPKRTTTPPIIVSAVMRSLRKKNPHTKPNSGMIYVTDAANAALTFAVKRKYKM